MKALRGTAIHELKVRFYFIFLVVFYSKLQLSARGSLPEDPSAPEGCCRRRRRQAGCRATSAPAFTGSTHPLGAVLRDFIHSTHCV